MVPPGLLQPLRPLPPEAELLKVTLLVAIVTHKGLRPRLRFRLGLGGLRWRLRLFCLGLGGLPFSLGCPWKGVKTVLEFLRLGCPDRFLRRVFRRLLKDAILGLVWLKGLSGVGLRKALLWGQLTPLDHLIQHTLKIGFGVFVPLTEPILLLELLN